MENLLFLNWLTLAIAISAFVFSNMLTDNGMIFHDLFEWLEERLPEWIFKPLIGCQYCVAGQWSLWFFIWFAMFRANDYELYLHIWFIMQTIFITKIVTEFYYRILDKK